MGSYPYLISFAVYLPLIILQSSLLARHLLELLSIINFLSWAQCTGRSGDGVMKSKGPDGDQGLDQTTHRILRENSSLCLEPHKIHLVPEAGRLWKWLMTTTTDVLISTTRSHHNCPKTKKNRIQYAAAGMRRVVYDLRQVHGYNRGHKLLSFLGIDTTNCKLKSPSIQTSGSVLPAWE